MLNILFHPAILSPIFERRGTMKRDFNCGEFAIVRESARTACTIGIKYYSNLSYFSPLFREEDTMKQNFRNYR